MLVANSTIRIIVPYKSKGNLKKKIRLLLDWEGVSFFLDM